MQKHITVKICATGVLAFILAMSPVKVPKSEAWLEIAGQMLGNTLAILRENINGIIMGAAKQTAVKMLNAEISGIVSGSSSQNSKIIGNYRDFLDVEPTQKTNIYINDYISQITSGRGSTAGYIPNNEGFGNGAFANNFNSNNYTARLDRIARTATTERPNVKLDYVGDPRQNLFSDGNFNNFIHWTSENDWASKSLVENEYQKHLAIEKEAALAEAIAGRGIKSTRQGDTITTPGSLTSDILASTQTVGLDVLANARNIPEVITATVQSIITGSIQNGIGNASGNVQRSIQGVTSKFDQSIANQAKISGPGSAWKNPDLPS